MAKSITDSYFVHNIELKETKKLGLLYKEAKKAEKEQNYLKAIDLFNEILSIQ